MPSINIYKSDYVPTLCQGSKITPPSLPPEQRGVSHNLQCKWSLLILPRRKSELWPSTPARGRIGFTPRSVQPHTQMLLFTHELEPKG